MAVDDIGGSGQGGAEIPLEHELQDLPLRSEDANEGIRAYVDKKTPQFKGRSAGARSLGRGSAPGPGLARPRRRSSTTTHINGPRPFEGSMRTVGAPLAVAALFLAGCLGTGGSDDLGRRVGLKELLTAATEPLWYNPQTTPHPAFGFPTMTHPAVGAAVPEAWKPIDKAPLPASIQGLEHFTATQDEVESGGGIALFGSLAFVPGYTTDSYILDISDPSKPVILSKIQERHRNVDYIAYPDGRLVLVFSTGDGKLPLWDVTEPTKPEKLGELKPTDGTHKVNVVPGTPIVYNANSNGGGPYLGAAQGLLPIGASGQTEIYDLTDPERPVHVADWKNGYGCHHIYFYIEPSQNYYRAICAGIEVTQLWDLADPRSPKVIVNVPVHEGNPMLPSTSVPPLRFSHFSILNDDHSVLIVGDETGGGSLPPGCDVHAEAAGRSVSGPLGNLWFYDVKDETNPRLLGWISPTNNRLDGSDVDSCTAHHGRLVPDPEGKRDLLAHAFYGSGVVLIDFTDPTNPRIVDQWNDGTDTWEVWYYNGYLFTGDLRRGLDVFTFT